LSDQVKEFLLSADKLSSLCTKTHSIISRYFDKNEK